MTKKSIAKNYIYNASYQILSMIIPFITTPYVSRVLGAESIGIYSYTVSIVTYFILFGSLGVGMYGKVEVAYVQDDKKARSKIFYEIILLRFITMIISALLYYRYFIIDNEYSVFYIILLVEFLSTCLDISWFFQGLEEFKKVVIRNMLVKLISVVAILLFVKSQNDLYIYFIINVLGLLLGNLTLWFYLPQYIQKVNIKELKILKHIKPNLSLFIPQIAIQVYNILDRTMLGNMLSDKSEVGYYEQSQKIVKLLLSIITSMGTVMTPRMANIYSNGKSNELKQHLKDSFHFVFLLSIPIVLGLISISDKFVPIFLGNGFEKTATLIKITSPIILIIGLSNLVGMQYLLPTKRTKSFTISVVSGAIINFILNLLLIKNYTSIGAAIATIIAEISVTAIQLYIIRKDINLVEVFKYSIKYIFAGLIMYFIISLTELFYISSYLEISVKVILGASVYAGFLIIMRDKYFTLIVVRILEKLGILDKVIKKENKVGKYI